MTILANGNVGIGTTAPVRKLDILGGGIRLGKWNNTAYTDPTLHAIEFLAPAGNFMNLMAGGGRIYAQDPYSALNPVHASLVLQAASDLTPPTVNNYVPNQLVLWGSGGVGINTDRPLANMTEKRGLEIKGNLRVTSAYNNYYKTFVVNNSTDEMNITGSSGIVSTVTSAGYWLPSSDIAFKENVMDIGYGLDTVLMMRPRKYDYKSNHQKGIGFIAQELEKVVPEVVSGEEGKKGVNYDSLVPILTKAIQQQQKEIEDLKNESQAQIELLKKEIAELKKG